MTDYSKYILPKEQTSQIDYSKYLVEDEDAPWWQKLNQLRQQISSGYGRMFGAEIPRTKTLPLGMQGPEQQRGIGWQAMADVNELVKGVGMGAHPFSRMFPGGLGAPEAVKGMVGWAKEYQPLAEAVVPTKTELVERYEQAVKGEEGVSYRDNLLDELGKLAQKHPVRTPVDFLMMFAGVKALPKGIQAIKGKTGRFAGVSELPVVEKPIPKPAIPYRNLQEMLRDLRAKGVTEKPIIKEKYDTPLQEHLETKNYAPIEGEIKAFSETVDATINWTPKKKIRVWSDLAKKLLWSAEGRLKSPTGREIVQDIIRADNIHGRRTGTGFEKLRQAGFFKLKHKDAEAFTDYYNKAKTGNLKFDKIGGAVKEYRDWVFAEATRLKVMEQMPDGSWRPMGYTKELPRMLKSDIAKEIFEDAVAIQRETQKRVLAGEPQAKAFQTIVDNAVVTKGFKHASTQRGIDHLLKTGKAKTPAEAMELLDHRSYNDMFGYFGSMERARRINFELPTDFWEMDARKIVTRYNLGQGKRLAQIEVFGQNQKKINSKLTRLRAEDWYEADIAEQTLSVFTGKTERAHALSPSLQKLNDAFIGYEVGAKIGLGTATIPQLTQPLISFIPDAGVWRSVRGGFNLLHQGQRNFVRQSGATALADVIQALAGETPKGIMGKFANVATKISGFKGANRMLQYWSASTYRVMMRDLSRLANKPGLRQNWAQKRLKDFGIDYKKPLTENATLEGMYRYAMDSQLQKNILRDPLWMNDPRLRWLALFKRFGYKQFKWQKDMIKREVVQGNPLPLLRSVAGGILGGEFVIWAKHKVKQLVSGQPYYRKEDRVWQRVVNDIAAVGSMGVITDLARVDEATVAGMVGEGYQNLAFQTTPVLGSDIERWGDITKGFFAGAKRRGFLGSAKRMAPKIAGQIGGVLAAPASKRLMSAEQKKDYMNRLVSINRQKAFDYYLRDDQKRGDAVIKRFNEHYPDRAFYVTPEDVEKERQRRLKLYGRI